MAKARRGRGEASVFQRESDGLWVGTLSLGYDANGKRIRKTVYAPTKSETTGKLRKIQNEFDAGRLVDAEELTTKEYLTRWLANTAKESIGDGTWERYRQLVEGYLVPLLGGIKLHKLRPLHVEQCYASLKAGTNLPKKVGADARKSAGVVLSIALKHAVRTGLIQSNPAADVKKARPVAREMAFMTAVQAKRFLVSAKPNQNFALFSLALGSGARQGELLGLSWPDLDFEKGTMDVRRSLSQVRGVFALKEPKSKSGRRTISLSPLVMAALAEHRSTAFKAGRITGPVFCTRTMGWLDRKNVLRAFRKIVKNTNAAERTRAAEADSEPDVIPEKIRFHDLRHTHASGLIAAGGSIKAVSRRLGHADVSITLRVYAHVMPDDDEKLAGLAGTLFG